MYMKSFNYIATKLLSLLLILQLTGCKKDAVAPIDKLPAATREGKNTFGCLVNGEAFLPKGSAFSGPNLECYYQNIIDPNPDRNGYFFGISATNKAKSSKVFNVNISTNSLAIKKGSILVLQKGIIGEATAAYYVSEVPFNTEYRTDYIYKGELHITHLDEVKQIVSGTFWFDAVNDKGEKVEVREGRFDVTFTR